MKAYKGAVAAFLQSLKRTPGQELVIINSPPDVIYVQIVDGMMLEGLFHASWVTADSHADIVSWLGDIQTFSDMLKLNKIILVGSGSEGSGDALRAPVPLFLSPLFAACQ